MKGFEFRLERVRRWRSEQASLEELKLQQLRSDLGRLEVARRQVEAEAARSALQVMAQPVIDPLELTSLESYRLHLRHRVFEFENLERQCKAKIDEQLKCVLEARRQFELLDKLHRKAREEWVTASNQEQEQLAAELFLAKSARSR